MRLLVEEAVLHPAVNSRHDRVFLHILPFYSSAAEYNTTVTTDTLQTIALLPFFPSRNEIIFTKNNLIIKLSLLKTIIAGKKSL